MSFKIAMLFCFILMCLVASITYYLGKKVSGRFMKYIPVFSFAVGVLFFLIRLNFVSYMPNSIDRIFDMIAIIILLVLLGIALLEAVIIDIVENTKLFGKGFMIIKKSIISVTRKKKQI